MLTRNAFTRNAFMCNTPRAILGAAALLLMGALLAPAAHAQSSSDSASSRFTIGPEVGVYLPTDSTVRDRFGKSWLSLGLGFGSFANVTDKGGLGFDLSLQYQKHGDNRVFLLPVGLGYRVALAQTEGNNGFVPYAGVTGDVYFGDIRAVQDNVHSGFHESGGGSLILGANVGKSANLEARYQLVGRIQGYDFSGLSLTAGYRF